MSVSNAPDPPNRSSEIALKSLLHSTRSFFASVVHVAPSSVVSPLFYPSKEFPKARGYTSVLHQTLGYVSMSLFYPSLLHCTRLFFASVVQVAPSYVVSPHFYPSKEFHRARGYASVLHRMLGYILSFLFLSMDKIWRHAKALRGHVRV